MRTSLLAILRRVWLMLLACFAFLALGRPAIAQEEPQPWTGEPGITETLDQIAARELALPPEPFRIRGTGKPTRIHRDRSKLPQDPDSPAVSQWPPLANLPPLPGYEERSPQTIGSEWQSETINDSGYIPPDTVGDVSPTQVVSMSNGRFKVWNKNGSLVFNVSANTLFSSVRNGSNAVDPRVVWDRTSARWFVLTINTSTPNRILLAVSSGAVLSGTASFTLYQFQQDLVGTTPNADTGRFADYPSLGVDANAVYTGSNMYAGNFAGTSGWVIRKSSVLSGGPIVVTAFRTLATAAGAGPFAPRGVTNYDPAATEGYFIGPDNATFGRLVLRRVSTPGGTPTISANINLTVPSTVNASTVPAMGSTINVEAGADQLFDARIYRNRVSGTSSIWTAQTIEVNSSGVASASGNRNGIRWYQVSNFSATPSLTQSGTVFDNAPSAPDYYLYATIASSGQGHAATAATVGASDRFLSAVFAGRWRTDANGTMRAPTIIEPGVAAYTLDYGAGRNRWGDYSSTVVDPADDQTLWTFQEYVSNTNEWAIRVTRLLAPPPVTPTACVPASVVQSASNVNVVVTGASASNSAFFDTDATFPSRLAAAFSGTGITINSVTWDSETQITLNISVTGGAPTGQRTLTVTNPDGQNAVSANILNVTVGCVSPNVLFQPNSLTRCEGESATFTISATGSPTLNYQWRKDNVNISGANSPSYTIDPVALSDIGSYTCRVTNGCGTDTSNPATLTVNTCGTPCDPDVNCDGTVNGFDIEATEQAVNGDFTNFCQASADLNGDGAENGFDVEVEEQRVNGAPC
ncbi:hypothetical protein PHYC_00351 [Phycisphaerales bacterium]|nr:hypothetical protein PHYC_00351 [Phycisphaerales bacterium]